MGYYNSQLALWEPLIEKVEVTQNNKTTYIPWELKLEVSFVCWFLFIYVNTLLNACDYLKVCLNYKLKFAQKKTTKVVKNLLK